MRFRGHESFFIRKGWLYKGIKNVVKKPDVFTDKTENPMDILGLGANMVRSLRYWLQAVGLTDENLSGKKKQELSPIGQIIWDKDRYIEEMGTLWLLQYKLASNFDEATAWYYFFNEFKIGEFKKDDFVGQLSSYAKIKDENKEYAVSSLEGDFECIINTYVSRKKSNPEKVHPESNIDCPFGELNLIDIVNKKEKVYKKSSPRKDSLNPLIVLAVIIDNAKDQKEIRINSLLTDPCNVGKIFNLEIIALTNYLYKLQDLGYIRVVRTAGLDVVRINTKFTFLDCVNKYYEEINN
ncbi:MAG TPA: DUF4007 family protein [Clostridium sp.]|jgi:hypothetical protein|nr:DUF4007 family protein [Clostridium sp.]